MCSQWIITVNGKSKEIPHIRQAKKNRHELFILNEGDDLMIQLIGKPFVINTETFFEKKVLASFSQNELCNTLKALMDFKDVVFVVSKSLFTSDI